MSLFHRSEKKLLVMFASPIPEGHTRRLLEDFLAPFRQENGWDIQEMNAYRMNPRPCTGCKACARAEKCAQPDLDAWDKALRHCDLLVVASPVYNCSFPAPFKAVLDRTQRYFEARFSLQKRPPIKKSRDAVLLLTQGSKEDFALEVCAHQLERAFSVMNTRLRGCAVWQDTDRGDGDFGRAQQQARKIALEILKEVC